MTHLFICDSCGAREETGTITGGKPTGWDVDYITERTITPPKTKRGREKVELIRVSKHYCSACAPSKGKNR